MFRRGAAIWSDRRALVVLAAVPAVAILVLHSREYVGFFADDSFISLRYAERFLEGKGLTYSGEERVEGYTNFLWVILVAAGGLLSSDLIGVARTLGTATMVLSVVTATALCRPRRAREVLPAAAAGLALALSGPVATWAVGGLETPLYCATIAMGLAFSYRLLESDGDHRRHCRLAGAAWALALLTRPDGLMFPFVAAAVVVAMRRFRPAALIDGLSMLAIPVATFAAHTLFRKAYYGDWVPNTYHAKMALSLHRAKEGLDYVATSKEALFALFPPLIFTGLAAVSHPLRRKRVILVLAALGVWMSYVVAIGGDIMRQYRHVVPALVMLGLLDAEGLMWLATKRGRSATVANFAAVAFVAYALVQRENNPGRQEALNERWEWSGRNVGLFLKRAFSEADPLLAVDAAGSTPFYSELDTVDMLGLNDRYLALHPPKNFGTGWMGHELGDGPYVLRRRPDLVMFVLPPGWEKPVARGSVELYGLPEFRNLYKLVPFDTGPQNREIALLWVRAEDGRLGVNRAAGNVVVPGYLFAEKDGPMARMISGSLRTVLESGDVGRVRVSLEPGSYRVEAEVTWPVSFRVRTPETTVDSAGQDLSFRVAQPGAKVGVEVRSAGTARVLVGEVRFVRTRAE